MTNMEQPGGSESPRANHTPHESQLSPADFFGELMIAAELKLLTALHIQEKTKKDRAQFAWVTKEYDAAREIDLLWYRLGESQQIGDGEDLIEIGIPTPEISHNTTITVQEAEAGLTSVNQTFILVANPRDKQSVFELDQANAQNYTREGLDGSNSTILSGLLGKISMYHVHPIRTLI